MSNPIARRQLADGRILEVWPMLCNVRLTVTEPENDGMCFNDAWCYTSPIQGLLAFALWNGVGEPAGWNKHPFSRRWRSDGTEASEINQDDDPALAKPAEPAPF